MLTPLAASRGQCDTSAGSPRVEIEDAGIKVLKQADITQPSDIDSAFMDEGFGYRVTWKDDPNIVTSLYNALRNMTSDPALILMPAGNSLTLNLKSGRSLRFIFHEEYSDPIHGGFRLPIDVAIPRTYHSWDMISVLESIRENQAAGVRGARIGQLSVSSIETRVPGGQNVTLMPCQPEGKALVSKATTVLDWLDARAARLESVEAKAIEAVGDERGLVALSLAKPLRLKMADYSGHSPPELSDAFEVLWPVIDFNCDRIVILHYGGVKPRIVARNMDTGRYYFVGDYLRRRDEERWGVEKYRLEGPPA